jgi:hemoglobin-like flavoprotein
MYFSRSFFGSYITLLGAEQNQYGIKTILNDMGKTHATRGVSKEQFNSFRSAFFDYMKTHSSWSDDAFHAWEKTYDKMYYVIFSNLDGKEVH